MSVKWLPSAKANLIAIAEYIARDNPPAAHAVHDSIQRRVGQLIEHPQIGRPGRIKETRELIVAGTPYIVVYRVAADDVVILRVLHGARQWPTQQ